MLFLKDAIRDQTNVMQTNLTEIVAAILINIFPDSTFLHFISCSSHDNA